MDLVKSPKSNGNAPPLPAPPNTSMVVPAPPVPVPVPAPPVPTPMAKPITEERQQQLDGWQEAMRKRSFFWDGRYHGRYSYLNSRSAPEEPDTRGPDAIPPLVFLMVIPIVGFVLWMML